MDEFIRGTAGTYAHFHRNVTAALSAGDTRAVEGVTRSESFLRGVEHPSQSEELPADFVRRTCVLGNPAERMERLTDPPDLGLSHPVMIGWSRDIDHEMRECSDHPLAAQVLPTLREHTPMRDSAVRPSALQIPAESEAPARA